MYLSIFLFDPLYSELNNAGIITFHLFKIAISFFKKKTEKHIHLFLDYVFLLT